MANVCDSYCKGCIYRGIINGTIPWCKYVFMEDKLRGCPPGTGCTVRMTDKDVKRCKEQEKKEQYKKRIELTAEQKRRKAERDREYLAKKRAEKRKVCNHCGKVFHPDKEHRNYCSEECAYKHHLITENERSKRRWAERKGKANGKKCLPGTTGESQAENP